MKYTQAIIMYFRRAKKHPCHLIFNGNLATIYVYIIKKRNTQFFEFAHRLHYDYRFFAGDQFVHVGAGNRF